MLSFITCDPSDLLVIIVIIVIMAIMLKVVFEGRCVLKKWAI